MPIYLYRRLDGTTFEIAQKITDDPLMHCPDTGQPCERIISGGSFLLRGPGWARDGYTKEKPPAT